MWLIHPINSAVINIDKYNDIRKCPKNPTHVDFYEKPQAESERGNPDYTITFKTEKGRDRWFEAFVGELDNPASHLMDPNWFEGEEQVIRGIMDPPDFL